jgi:hypothetical protein
MSASKPDTLTVQFHFGAEHTSFPAALTDALSALKERATSELKIVVDPSFDYFLNYKGDTVEDEAQTLGHLQGEHATPHVQFHIKKRPKGGTPA